MKQLFLIDEDLSPLLVTKLKQLGYNTKSVREIKLKGANDTKIIDWAIKNNAVIITGDKDFGELWYWSYRGKIGVILLRLKSYKIETQNKAIEFLHENNVLKNKNIKNALVITTPNKYRIRTKRSLTK